MTIKQFNDEGKLCSNHAEKINTSIHWHGYMTARCFTHLFMQPYHFHIPKKGWKLIYLCIYFWMYYAFIWQAIIYHLTFHDVLFCIKGHKQPKHGQHLSCRFQTSLTSPFKQCSPPIGTRTTQCRQYHTYKKQHPPWSKDVISADLYPRIVIAHVRSYYLIQYPSQKRIWLHLILTTWIW